MEYLEVEKTDSALAKEGHATVDNSHVLAAASVEQSELISDNSTLFEKLFALFRIAAPLTVSYGLRCGESLIQLFFAGILSQRSGDTKILAGVSLATMFYNVSFLSMIVGMSTALDTLGSQYNGAQKHAEVVIVTQRSVVVFAVMLVPMCIIWSFIGDIFTAVGVDEQTVSIMQHYFMIIGWIAPGKICIVTYRKYLMCMGLTWPHMYMNLVADVVLLLLCALALHMNWDLTGIAWAWVVASYAGAIFLIVLTYHLPEVQRSVKALPFLPLHRDSWSWDGIKEYICLGLPGMVMVCSEWWAYEIMMVFASMLGPDAVAAQALIFQLSNLTFMVPSCTGVAANVLVGNALGASHRQLSIDMSQISLGLMAVTEASLIMPVMLFCGRAFISLYSSDSAVMWEADRAIPILAATSFCDGIQGVASGILRGTGNQKIGAFANLACFYIIGVPLSYAFCFHLKLRVSGLILGLSVAVAIQCGILLFFIFCRQDIIFAEMEGVDANRKYDSVSQEPETETETDTETEIDVTGSECDDIELMVNATASDADCGV